MRKWLMGIIHAFLGAAIPAIAVALKDPRFDISNPTSWKIVGLAAIIGAVPTTLAYLDQTLSKGDSK